MANIYQIEIDGVEGFLIALQLDNLERLEKFVKSNGQANSTLKMRSDRQSAEQTEEPPFARSLKYCSR
jgi:hypothetical protein